MFDTSISPVLKKKLVFCTRANLFVTMILIENKLLQNDDMSHKTLKALQKLIFLPATSKKKNTKELLALIF